MRDVRHRLGVIGLKRQRADELVARPFQFACLFQRIGLVEVSDEGGGCQPQCGVEHGKSFAIAFDLGKATSQRVQRVGIARRQFARPCRQIERPIASVRD